MGVQQLLLEIMLAMWVTEASLGKAASVAKANCQDICGNVTIPYPFGIGGACSGHESYVITCNTSFTPPRPFLTSVNLEVLEISVNGTVRVNSPIITSNCPNRDNGRSVNLSNSLFSFSDTYNRFTAIGCNNLALISQSNVIIGGCMSFCSHELFEVLDIQSCYGIKCCQNQIPPFLKCVNVSHRSTHDYSSAQEDCQYAFIVDQDWFSSLTKMNDVKDMQHVPAVLDWRTTGNCNTFGDYTKSMSSSLSLCSSHAFCSERSLCTCLPNYGGNPYLPRGCQGKVPVKRTANEFQAYACFILYPVISKNYCISLNTTYISDFVQQLLTKVPTESGSSL